MTFPRKLYTRLAGRCLVFIAFGLALIQAFALAGSSGLGGQTISKRALHHELIAKRRGLLPLAGFKLARQQMGLSSASLSALPEGSGFVLYEDEEGNVICREATPEQVEAMNRRDPSQPLQVISPLRMAEQQTGLKIILRGTSQLDSYPQAKAAFLNAARTWENLIGDPITIVIDVDFGPTRFGQPYEQGVLGSTNTQTIGSSSIYPTVRNSLVTRASSAQEESLYNSLPTGTVPTDLGNTPAIYAPSAVFRAMGLINAVADPEGEKGQFGPPPSIGFNSNYKFDFDPSNGIDSDKTDFDAVAVHEIGHALGFSSEVGSRELDPSTPLGLSTWDLFRFRPGTTLATFSTAQRILSSGGNQVFFAGGPELALSTGRPDGSGGDGQQASHWKDDAQTGTYIGIMDPTIARGVRETITDNDLKALDTFGFRVTGGGGQADTVDLTSGVPQTGSIPAPSQGSCTLGQTQYRIEVPTGAAQLKVDLSGNQDVDLFVRFSQRVTVQGGSAVADYKSDTQTGNESVTILPTSTPPLRQGAYFIAIANCGPGAATFTVTATVTGGQQPDQTAELSTDDGTAETGAQGAGAIVVNRLTPPRYPATLQTLRIFFAQFQGLPSPSGAQITLIVFAEASGSGQPPNNPQRLVNQTVTIPNLPSPAGGFVDFTIQNGPTISSGDFYVGFQSPTPPGGVVFVADTNGPQQRRAFVSDDGGKTFAPLVFRDQQGNQVQVNIMIRAVVSFGAAAVPDIDVQPPSLDFGTVSVGATADRTLTVYNGGTASLTVSSMTIDSARFSVVSPSTPFSVSAGGQQTVTVRFAPTAAGLQTAALRISSNDPDEGTVTVSLSGQGMTVAPGRILSVPDSRGEPGRTVTIPINLSEGSGVSALQFTLSFNPAVLSLSGPQSVTRGSLVPGNFSLSANTATAGQVTVVISPPVTTPIPSFQSGSGSVVSITFQVAQAAATGTTSSLTLSQVSASDPNGSPVSITSQNGTFTVGAVRTLSVADAQGAAGSTVTIPVSLSEGSGVSALQFTLSFDSSILTPAATNPVALGSLVPSSFSVSANTATAGQITVVISPPIISPLPTFNSGSGPVVQITFQVASTASGGATSPLTLSNISASDSSGNAVGVNPQHGTFTVTAVRRGDVNQDGVVNVQDLIRLIQHLTGEKPLTGNGLLAADVNGDGQVNVQDLIRLIQHLTGERPLSMRSDEPKNLSPRGLTVGESFWSDGAITLPIMISEGEGVAAAEMVIEYDPARVRVDESAVARLTEFVPEGFELYVNAAQAGRLVVVLVPPIESPLLTLPDGPGGLFHLRFIPLNGVEDAGVRIVRVVLSDNEGRLVPSVVEP